MLHLDHQIRRLLLEFRLQTMNVQHESKRSDVFISRSLFIWLNLPIQRIKDWVLLLWWEWNHIIPSCQVHWIWSRWGDSLVKICLWWNLPIYWRHFSKDSNRWCFINLRFKEQLFDNASYLYIVSFHGLHLGFRWKFKTSLRKSSNSNKTRKWRICWRSLDCLQQYNVYRVKRRWSHVDSNQITLFAIWHNKSKTWIKDRWSGTFDPNHWIHKRRWLRILDSNIL